MADLNTAQTQVQTARTQVETQRAKAKEESRRLEEARKKLPSATSQRALRQTRGGLQGRTERREIVNVEKEIGTQREKVRQFEAGLTKFEEEKLKPAEESIKKTQEYNLAVEKIQRAAAQGKVGYFATYGEGIEKELAEQ